MPRLHPGVYIEEVSSGVRPIEGVSTSNGAFIGKAEMGPLNKAQLVTSLAEFQTKYGGFLNDSFLAHGVFQFFNNGGKKTYVIRVAGPGATVASIAIKDRKSVAARTLQVQAANEGVWGNKLSLVITDDTGDPANAFTLQLFKNRDDLNPPLPPQLLETFEGLVMDPSSPNFVEKLVAAKSKYITVTADQTNLATAGQGTSRSGALPVGNGAAQLKLGGANGGTEAPGASAVPASGTSTSGATPSQNPAANQRQFTINLDNDGPQQVIVPTAAATGNDIATAIQTTVRALVANNVSRQPAYAGFTATFTTTYNLVSGSTGPGSSVVVTAGSANDGSVALKLGTANGGAEASGSLGAATSGTSVGAAGASTNPAADQRAFNLNLDSDGAQTVVVPPGPSTGADIAAAIQSVVQNMSAIDSSKQAAYSNFTCKFSGGVYTLQSGSTGPSSKVQVTDATSSAVTLGGSAFTAGSPAKFLISVNGDGPHEVTLAGPYPITGGANIANAIQTAVRAIVPTRTANAAAFSAFAATYDAANNAGSPALVLTSGSARPSSSVQIQNSSGPQNAAGVLALGVSNGGRESSGAATLRPANSKQPTTEYNLGSAAVNGNVAAVVAGAEPNLPSDLEHKNGLNALDTVLDVNIVCIPGISTPDVISTGVNYCAQRGDCFFIGDTHPTDDTVDEARSFVDSITVKSSFGAVYYPWLQIADPTGAATSPIPAPPSGFVAGMYARIDATRGVFKAPAGTEANIAGAVGLVADTTDAQQDFLNPKGVNVIRTFPASGIVIWGARTLATLSNPEYRYIPVRRMAIFLEQSIYNGIQYAVFEPNDTGLWASLRLNIGAFMMLQFRAGAFQGKTPNDAFFVKVDETTTTQQDIDAGTVNILVGFAPLKPAEFVVLQLTQKAGQPAA